jgi:hypothetical protein
LLRVTKELPEGAEKLCCQQKTTGSEISDLSSAGFILIFSYLFFFYMNEKILMGKYKRRKDNVIWGKEDGCPPSPLPRILFPFSTPATPFLFSAHWRRKYDQIVRLHDDRACVVSSICTDCYRILFYADSRCLITCESVILSTSVCRSVILMEPLDLRGKTKMEANK